MTLTKIPTWPTGRIKWQELLKDAKPGSRFVFPLVMRHKAPTQFCRNGLITTSTVQDHTVVITVIECRPPSRKTSNISSEITAAQARAENLPARIITAKSKADHWKREANQAELRSTREFALANHAAWKMTAARLEAQLSERIASRAAAAA